MYRHLQSLAAFVAVGETGAFVKAAKTLGVAPSVISHHIARLEEALGETLIHRTTRSLTLSANGQRLFEATRGNVSDIIAALRQIESQSNEIAGALHVALPAFIPDPALEAKIMEFATQHPNVALSLDYSDAIADLVEGGYDLAIRLGDLPSSTLMRQKLGTVTHVLVASPQFILRYGPITAPEMLSDIPFIAMGPSFDVISLERARSVREVELSASQIQLSSIFGAKSAALAGLGIGNLPEALVGDELQSGAFVQILPDWKQPELSVQAVWSANSHRSVLAQHFVRFLSAG